MSLESLLLNALKCHLVFAGSLQLTEGWGRGGGGRGAECWGTCQTGAGLHRASSTQGRMFSFKRFYLLRKWEQELENKLCSQESRIRPSAPLGAPVEAGVPSLILRCSPMSGGLVF